MEQGLREEEPEEEEEESTWMSAALFPDDCLPLHRSQLYVSIRTPGSSNRRTRLTHGDSLG